MDKLVLSACRRGWTRFDSIINAVLRADTMAKRGDVIESVQRLVRAGKLAEKSENGFKKWHK